MHIEIITTGGTIDKDYPRTTKGWAFEIGEPAVKEILPLWNPPFSYEIHSFLKKDSQQITKEDRKNLVSYIEKIAGQYLIIFHGTDTMIETGQYLAKKILNKTIILTGAMRPAKFVNSDAGLNIGAAFTAVQILPIGVYLTMNGITSSINKVVRDTNTGRFVQI